MQSKILALALLSSTVLAAPQNERRQATNPADFSSAVAQLITAYIPQSAVIPIGAAIQSAAAASGISAPIDVLVASALAEPTPPAYLTAIPSQYANNVNSLAGAISSLRGAASTGIPGAPVVSIDSTGSAITTGTFNAVTTTDSAGVTIVGVTGASTDSAGSVTSGITSTISTGGAAASVPSGAIVTTDSAGSTITGLAVTTTDSASSTITSLTSTLSGFSNSTTSTETTSTTSTGTTTATTSTGGAAAAPSTTTGAAVPGAVAPGVGGVIGLVGFLLAL
ncbi:MAG: hypothetical protein M1832_005210 [Thelocarpon impressellum]|nr:MAG: hypothetical protein M1832_005210 [Thelocarpon impressellum]